MSVASIRDLRNHGGEVIDRVAAGGRVTITRGGRAVAELRPMPRRRMTSAQLAERYRCLPAVDPDRLGSDIDALIGRTL